jgi:hypothetical protein
MNLRAASSQLPSAAFQALTQRQLPVLSCDAIQRP